MKQKVITGRRNEKRKDQLKEVYKSSPLAMQLSTQSYCIQFYKFYSQPKCSLQSLGQGLK